MKRKYYKNTYDRYPYDRYHDRYPRDYYRRLDYDLINYIIRNEQNITNFGYMRDVNQSIINNIVGRYY